jgi:hypothetical protein
MRKITLRDRINYHLSFSMAERIERRKEKLAQFVAWHCLPERVIHWVIVRRHASLTSGAHGSRHPDQVSAFDLYKKAA